MENQDKEEQNSLTDKIDKAKNKNIEDNKTQKKEKKEIAFDVFIKDKKTRLIELKNFFENEKNYISNDLRVSDFFSYDSKDDLLEIFKKLLSLYSSNKTIKIPYLYKKLIYEFTIIEIIKINGKDHNLNTLNLEDLKNNFLPNPNDFETIIKLSNFFASRTSNEDTSDKIFLKDNLIFLEMIKVYLNQLVGSVNWFTLDKIVKLIHALENLKPNKLNERKVISNSLFFINKLDYIFSLNEFFVSFKIKMQELSSIQNSNENTIIDLKRVITNKVDQISVLNQEKSELENEIITLKDALKKLDVESQSSEAGSAQKQNEIIGRMQTKLSSFLSYELNIASEAVLDGEEGAKMASKMIEELIIKIKEEKSWLSASD